MDSKEELRREAAEVRMRYQETNDPQERNQLQQRYAEIGARLQKAENPTPAIESRSIKKRVSLGRVDELDDDEANLLELCEIVTQDGTISDSEIETLRVWLARKPRGSHPAADFLSDALAMIDTGREITATQRTELHKAIEKVLPADRRRFAAERRRLADALEKERIKSDKELERERLRTEKALSRPLKTADFTVAGVSYDGRATTIERYVKTGDAVFLIRDRRNKFSRFAIEIRTRHGYQIGYVPEEYAVTLAPILDDGYPHVAKVKKILTRGEYPRPVIIADFFNTDARVPGLTRERDVPLKRARPGCLSVGLLLLGTVGTFLALLA